jgi:uncharacterized membrane protein YhaH (DUF805 family)
VRDVAVAQEHQQVRLWSPTGRIGRLRYLAYVFGFQMLMAVIAGTAAAIAPDMAGLVLIPAYLVLLVFSILQAIKRSHDMNWSGWTVFLMLIPLVALIWLVKPGTEVENRFGHPPPPNTTLIKVAGLALPVLFIAGIVAAIVIPAYSDYVQRAQGLQ